MVFSPTSLAVCNKVAASTGKFSLVVMTSAAVLASVPISAAGLFIAKYTPGSSEAAAAKEVGENTILSRAGGAPTLAVGMAHIMSRLIPGEAMMAFWYHFALLFEALFILTAEVTPQCHGKECCNQVGRDRVGVTEWFVEDTAQVLNRSGRCLVSPTKCLQA
jgi:hypothetical protein